MDDQSQNMADLDGSEAAPEAQAAPQPSQEEREHLVAQILERQNRLHTLAEQALKLRQPPALQPPVTDAIALGDASSLRFDPESKMWRFQANADAEAVDVHFGGVRYGAAVAPAVAVDADKGSFSVELPRSPGKLTAQTTPSELLRRALSRDA